MDVHFYRYFKEHMAGLGLPAPEGLFGTVQAAVANASVILSQIDKFGRRITIKEIIGAGTRLEGLGIIAGCSAAFYVAAVIGSLAVATGRTLSGGTSLADVLVTAQKYRLLRPWMASDLHRWPEIYDPKTASRSYRLTATTV
jgi:hypothetical protein